MNLEGSQGERRPFVKPRESFVAILRQQPEVIDYLGCIPAFWERGADPGVGDISIKELLDRSFGITKPATSLSKIAKEIGAPRVSVARTSKWCLEWLRQNKFPDSLAVAVSSPYQDSLTTRINTLVQIDQLLRSPKEENNLPFLISFYQLPLFNSKAPPKVVEEAVEKSLNNESFNATSVPTVGYFLTRYFGINADRKNIKALADELGYAYYGSLDEIKSSILYLLDKQCGTSFFITRPESDIEAEANSITRPKSAIKAGSKTLEVRLARYIRARSTDAFPERFEESAVVSTTVARLLLWGVGPTAIVKLVNPHLVSVLTHQAPELNTRMIISIDIGLKGTHKVGKIVGRSIDRREQAGRLLESLEKRQKYNQRPTIILKVLERIRLGLSNSNIQVDLGIEEKTVIGNVARSARTELLQDPDFRKEVVQLFIRIADTDDPMSKKLGRKMRLISAELYPLYKRFREKLGDQPEKGIFTSLSERERSILILIAQGANRQIISKALDLKGSLISTDQRLLLKPKFGANYFSKDGLALEYKRLHEALLIISEDEALLAKYYPSEGIFIRDMQIINDRIELPLWQLFEKYKKPRIYNAIKRVRAVVTSIEAGQTTIRRRG